MAVLPKQDEEFAQGHIVKNIMYVGHNSTTRREQIQFNWSVETEPIMYVEDDAAADETPQGSPVKRPDVAAKAVRRSPRRPDAAAKAVRRSPRRPDAAAAGSDDTTDDSDAGSDDTPDDSDSDYGHSVANRRSRGRQISLENYRRTHTKSKRQPASATVAKKKLDFASASASEFDTPEVLSKRVC